MVNRKLLH